MDVLPHRRFQVAYDDSDLHGLGENRLARRPRLDDGFVSGVNTVAAAAPAMPVSLGRCREDHRLGPAFANVT
jgi:hypothetical protein